MTLDDLKIKSHVKMCHIRDFGLFSEKDVQKSRYCV